MIINLIAIGKNMPTWVTHAYNEYAKRLPVSFALNLVEIPAITRNKNSNLDKIKTQESQLLMEACTPKGLTIALDECGKSFSTRQLADQLSSWREQYRHINVLVGGPDGLEQQTLSSANIVMSLSNLTLPHPLVRVIFAEQIYRAYSIITHHPYHRE